MRTGRLVLASAVIALSLGFVSAPADAAAPRDQGWWTVTNPVPAPDVPARGLLVQAGGGGAPTAFGAVLYELDPGTTAYTLTLAIAPNTASTPTATLQVCPLLQPIVHPDQGGPMSNAPPYDCSRKASAAPDGNNYKFDAASLANDRVVAVAILPTGPLDRVVLNPPDDASLATQAGSAAPDSSSLSTDTVPAPTSDAVPAGDLSTSTAPVGDSSAAISLPGVTGDASSSVAPAPASVPPPTAQASNGGAFVPAVSSGPEEATPILVILLIVGALGAVFLWLYAGRERTAVVV